MPQICQTRLAMSLTCLCYTEYHRRQTRKKKKKRYTRSNGSRGKETPKPIWGSQEDFIEVVMVELRTKD